MIDEAQLPPTGLPGLDPRWSRLVAAADFEGTQRTWHLLDTHADRLDVLGMAMDEPTLTLLCVHGNPTWSYLWRRLLLAAPDSIRVVAVDQLDMGYSERTGVTRRLADRVSDLDGLTRVLGLSGPVVTVAHDWGGPISLGWALAHPSALAGVVLLNTAVHQPAGSPAPGIIRLARSRPLLRLNTTWTSMFIAGTSRLSRSLLSGVRMDRSVARGFSAPYGDAGRRRAIGDFVADIPLEPSHPSTSALDEIAAGIKHLADVPALLLWGPNDPVFSDRYLVDLTMRLPSADIHRYERAGHLVIEDAPALVPDLLAWIQEVVIGGAVRSLNPVGSPDGAPSQLLDELRDAAANRPSQHALVEMNDAGVKRRVTWSQLATRVEQLAGGLHQRGIKPGDRVSLLIPPGADLIAVVYACWAIGATCIVADSGLGVAGMRRAIRGTHADHVIGVATGLGMARTLHIPGLRISVSQLKEIAECGGVMPSPPTSEAEAVVVFTSGATGPAKGVIYRHRQVAATVSLLRRHYSLSKDDALVAAFAPWAVLGPALGITSVLPSMDVTKPRTLTARALADATGACSGTVLWASPAALANVVATSDSLNALQRSALSSIRLALSAGAPVPVSLLMAAQALMPNAELRTPYGMTEALPVADCTLAEILDAGTGDGVMVGLPVEGVEIAVAALDAQGEAGAELSTAVGVTGEIAVRAQHIRDHYDALWRTDRRSSANIGWHRTGDVGHLDESGRLWIEGRLSHVIVSDGQVFTPVGIEQRALALPFVDQAACVAVGPRGASVPVLVIICSDSQSGVILDAERTSLIRIVTSVDLAAVLCRSDLPVDIRHNSKIDRTALSFWANEVLSGS